MTLLVSRNIAAEAKTSNNSVLHRTYLRQEPPSTKTLSTTYTCDNLYFSSNLSLKIVRLEKDTPMRDTLLYCSRLLGGELRFSKS